jgi:hypothetical protein
MIYMKQKLITLYNKALETFTYLWLKYNTLYHS